MATWTVSTDGNPIFCSKNYINQDSIDYGTFTTTEMSSLVSRIIDGDPFSYWQGSTSDDTVTVTLTFSFNSKSAITSQTFDLLVLQNINWKNFIGEYSTDGTNWTTITGTDYQSGVANNASTDLVINITAGVTAKYVRFRIFKTITANSKKQCGGVIVCAGQVQLSSGFLNYGVKYRETVRQIIYADGSLSREYILRSAASYEFWGASFDCPIVTTAELTSLRTIKRAGTPFILIPEPGAVPRDAYLCHFSGAWGHAYENQVRSAGYAIPMQVQEVGSH